VVLSATRRGGFAVACVIGMGGCASGALAQSTVAPAVEEANDLRNRSEGVTLGPVKVVPSADFHLDYDSNVYAEPSSASSDVTYGFSPQIEASYARQNLRFNTLASANVVRFGSLTRENYVTATIRSSAMWLMQAGTQLGGEAGFSRLAEDRGAVESRLDQTLGPRITNLLSGGLTYRRERGRLLVELAGRAEKFDNLAAVDSLRDFSVYGVTAKTGMRIAGATYLTATGFASFRDFRLPAPGTLANRDSVTYGFRGGIDLTSNPFLQGRVGVGLFRFDARSDTIPDHTGVSVDASLTYRPRRRTAIVLDAFRGDVATFRLGATARTDTSVGLTVQQVARHNLFGSLGAFWRETRYQGDTRQFRTSGGRVAIEYLVNRSIAVIGTATYTQRRSDDPFSRFERFRAGITLRLTPR